jgi:hypothetical protein
MPVLRPRLLALLFLLAAAAGCQREPRSEETWRDAGFIRHVPAATEAYLSLHGAERWKAVLSAWAPLLADPGIRKVWSQTPAGRITEPFQAEDRLKGLLQALSSSPPEEAFVAFGPGTASQLAALQQVKRLFEAARVRNLFTPVPDAGLVPPEENDPAEELPEDLADAAFTEVMLPLPPAMQEALENFVRHAAIPPVVAGLKLAPDDDRLPALLEAWVDRLPEKIPRDKFPAGEHGEFTRVRLPVLSVVPREAAVRARDLLAANIGDPYAATYLIRDLMAKSTTLCFGRARGYFLVTVGLDDPREALAPDFADSLPAKGVLDRVASRLGPGQAALIYADPLIVSLAAAPPPVGEYLDAAMESALEFAPGDAIRSLRSAAAPLRGQADELFHPRVAALGGVVRETEGRWSADLFGGSLAPRLAQDNARPLLAPDPRMDVTWTEHWEADYAARVVRFAAGVSTFAEKWIENLGPVFLEAGASDRMGAFLGLLTAALQPFGGDAADLFEKTFTHNVAFAADLDGMVSGGPSVLPRMAVAAGLRDRQSLGALRAKIAESGVLPLMTPVETTPGAGTTTYAYPLPLVGPDFAPAVTVDANRWVFGTSPSFTAEVAAVPGAPRGHSSVQSIRLATAPVAALGDAWAGALERDGSLSAAAGDLLPSEPAALRAAARLLRTPRHFVYEARWNREVLHRVITLEPAP